jgi:hypothetical protein
MEEKSKESQLNRLAADLARTLCTEYTVQISVPHNGDYPVASNSNQSTHQNPGMSPAPPPGRRGTTYTAQQADEVSPAAPASQDIQQREHRSARWKRILKNVRNEAGFSFIRGMATATGSAAVALVLLWVQQH